jgi:ABC-type polar amino acid transport system ATPase subunit
MIKIKGVQKKFGKLVVLDDINLTFDNDIVAILGPSGGGKSTLLRCINCLEKIDGGEIEVYGQSVRNKKHFRDIRKNAGMVFQQFNLFPQLTVLDNIRMSPMKLLGKNKKEATENALELLEKVDLSEKCMAFPEQLSGGQQQRIAIARALAMQPKALLLDEITSALDPEMTTDVMQIIDKLAQEGVTLLCVTHEMSFARRTANRIVFLLDGKIYFDASSEDFFKSNDGRIKQFLQHIET